MRLPLPLAIAATAAALLPVAPSAASARGEYSGRLEIRHADDFAHHRSQTTYRLVRRGHSTPLTLTQAPRTPSGSAVVVRGRRVGKRIRGTVRARGILHAAGVAAGPRATAVILVNFAADTRTPWTADYVRQRVFTASDSVNAFYSEESYGDVTLVGAHRTDGDVYGWYTITPASTGCNTADWAGKAKVAATADGFRPVDYQHVIYLFPQQASCAGWAGLGELPGRQSWINGALSTRVIAHELGHNMGLHHASSLACTAAGAAVAYSATCTPDEYGDPFDVMGSALRHNNAWHLRQIGFMAAASARVATTSGTYTLGSAIARGDGTTPQLLRVPTGSGLYYDLELRATGGVFDSFASTDPAVQGLTIHLDPETSVVTQSLLIDATPGSPSGFADAPLAPGHSFSDGTVSISLRSVSAGVATVDIVSAPVPDTTPPSAPGPLVAQAAADRVGLSWPAATDDVGVTGYFVYRDGARIAAPSSPGFTDIDVSPGGSYSYRVEAYDAAGNVSTSASVQATVPAPPPPTPPTPDPQPDPVAPVAPVAPITPVTPITPPVVVDPPFPPPAGSAGPAVKIVSPAPGAHVRRRAVVRTVVSDSAAVVRTEVWVDGRLRRSLAASHVAWHWSLRHARRGRHLIVVRAFDAAGKHGSASVRVRVTR